MTRNPSVLTQGWKVPRSGCTCSSNRTYRGCRRWGPTSKSWRSSCRTFSKCNRVPSRSTRREPEKGEDLSRWVWVPSTTESRFSLETYVLPPHPFSRLHHPGRSWPRDVESCEERPHRVVYCKTPFGVKCPVCVLWWTLLNLFDFSLFLPPLPTHLRSRDSSPRVPS